MDRLKRASGSGMFVVVLLLAVAGIARAQDTEPTTIKPYAVKVGAFLVSNGMLKQQATTDWWYLGADYFPNFRYRLLNADVGFGVDLKFRDTSKKSIFADSLTAKMLWPLPIVGSSMRAYGGLGAGIYFINTADLGGTTQAGLKFVFGLDFSNRCFIEANYDWVNGFTDNLGTGLRVDGTSVMFGVRF